MKPQIITWKPAQGLHLLANQQQMFPEENRQIIWSVIATSSAVQNSHNGSAPKPALSLLSIFTSFPASQSRVAACELISQRPCLPWLGAPALKLGSKSAAGQNFFAIPVQFLTHQNIRHRAPYIQFQANTLRSRLMPQDGMQSWFTHFVSGTISKNHLEEKKIYFKKGICR